jgi:hypothetical protein
MGDIPRVLLVYIYTVSLYRTRKGSRVWKQKGHYSDKLSFKFASFNDAVNSELYSVRERNHSASRGACVHK